MKLLGDLEKDVMNIVWKGEDVTVREVHRALQHSHGVAYTTVMTVMCRLAEKGLLTRREEGGAYVYAPAISQAEFFSGLGARLMRSIHADFGQHAAAAFVSELSRMKRSLLPALAFSILLVLGGARVWASVTPGTLLWCGRWFAHCTATGLSLAVGGSCGGACTSPPQSPLSISSRR